MLYFFHGDSQKASDKANMLISKMLEKKPDASLFVIDEENFGVGILQEMSQSSALFQNKYIVHIKRILDKKDFEETILKFLKEIKESENIFVWNEGEIKSSTISKIEKYSEKSVDVGTKIKTEEKNRIFEICNYLVNRDKKGSWTKYQELLKIYPSEELHGTIFWQFKNMGIVAISNSLDSTRDRQKESGLAPFPYQNAKKGLDKYSKEEILEKVYELSKIVHEARSGGAELEISLEQFILNL